MPDVFGNVLSTASADMTEDIRLYEVDRRRFLAQAGSSLAAGGSCFQMAHGADANKSAPLVTAGQAQAAVVVGRGAGKFYRWIASEVQRCVRLLSGADIPIINAGEKSLLPAQLVLGGPQANELVLTAQQQKLVDFSGLKRDGFLLESVALGGKPSVILGGNDEASTMYAAYEFLGRLGLVFQLTGDVIPEQKRDLVLPALKERMEPSLKLRGLHIRPLVMPWMGIEHYGQLLDQMAKMKCNYLDFYWYMGAPWIQFSHRGESALIGDLYTKESGYTTWRYSTATFTPSDVEIGRSHFKQKRFCAAEFQEVGSPEEAHRAAPDLLRQIIKHAHQRKIEVRLGLGDCPAVPPNLGRHAGSPITTPSAWFFGPFIPAGNPAGLGIWKSAVKSMMETYPEADGYWVWLAEGRFRSTDDDTAKVIRRYDAYRRLIPELAEIRKLGFDPSEGPTSAEDIYADIALLHYGKELAEFAVSLRSNARFGIAVLGRSYLFRALHTLLPKQVAVASMESSGVWTPHANVPMELFADLGERERLLVPRLDDDGNGLAAQFNAGLFHHDRVLQGSASNGVTGIAPQTAKLRGGEHNAAYLLEGCWRPAQAPDKFYAEYCTRLFGNTAGAIVAKTCMILDKNEAEMGWRGFSNFVSYGDSPEITLMARFAKQANKFEPPDFAMPHRDRLKAFVKADKPLQQSLDMLYEARKKIPTGSRGELEYLIFKTESYRRHLEVVRALLEGFRDYGAAFVQQRHDKKEFLALLYASAAGFARAAREARGVARQMAEKLDHPTEQYILFRYNVRFLNPIREFCKFISNVVDFHHGRPYWGPVNWEIIAPRQWTDS